MATRDFHIGFLGFEVTFEHRFESNTPLSMRPRRGACQLHLSEHFGDAVPGAGLRIEVADARAYREELLTK